MPLDLSVFIVSQKSDFLLDWPDLQPDPYNCSIVTLDTNNQQIAPFVFRLLSR